MTRRRTGWSAGCFVFLALSCLAFPPFTDVHLGDSRDSVAAWLKKQGRPAEALRTLYDPAKDEMVVDPNTWRIQRADTSQTPSQPEFIVIFEADNVHSVQVNQQFGSKEELDRFRWLMRDLSTAYRQDKPGFWRYVGSDWQATMTVSQETPGKERVVSLCFTAKEAEEENVAPPSPRKSKTPSAPKEAKGPKGSAIGPLKPLISEKRFIRK